jgi:8-oxo-dGTP pyrophosphatase MutT (NUDIX family)
MAANIISCGALIYCTSTDRYLFLLRNMGRYTNTWGIVGGKVDIKENVKQALIREIQEELGGEFKDAQYLNVDKYESKNKEFVYYTFLVKVEEEFVPILNKEHKGYCWVNLNDLPNPIHPGLAMTINSEIKRKNLKILQNSKLG